MRIPPSDVRDRGVFRGILHAYLECYLEGLVEKSIIPEKVLWTRLENMSEEELLFAFAIQKDLMLRLEVE